MIDISYAELIRLKDGEPPWSINKNWDCAMVIEKLAKDLHFVLEPTYESLEEMHDDLTNNNDSK